jgi:hypothetical protein
VFTLKVDPGLGRILPGAHTGNRKTAAPLISRDQQENGRPTDLERAK